MDEKKAKPKKQWTKMDIINDLYKRVLPGVFSRLAKLEAKLNESTDS